MKTMKTIAAAALLVLSTTLMAQGQGNRQMRSATERATNETLSIAKVVSLTPEQAAKILEINMKYATKDSIRFAEMRASGATIDREAIMKARHEQIAAQSAEIKAVMNDEQKAKYESVLKEREEQLGQRMEGQGGKREGKQGGRQGGRQGGQRPE